MINDKKNILIVGNGAKASALAKKLSQYEETDKIYITNQYNYKCEYYEFVDIREDDTTQLLKFVLENEIDLTIPISNTALKSDIVSFFQTNGQDIFGPCEKASRSFINKISCKKFLYKNKAQGTKFVIYSKYAQAIDYIKNSAFPLIISVAETTNTQDSSMLCTTFSQAEKFIEKLYLNGETDVLIQEYPYGTNFTAYFVTDGYSAAYLTSVRNFKFQNSDNSGKYTEGTGCYAPEYRLNNTVLTRLLNILQNVLKNLDEVDAAYTGIIGIECVLTGDDKFFVQDLKPFLQNHDARAVLNLCNDNLLNIMISCINGSFSDEYEQIKTNDYSSVSVCVQLPEGRLTEIPENFDIDYNNIYIKDSKIYSKGENTFIITKSAPTLSGAKDKIVQVLEELRINDIKYRKDICDKIKT